MSQNRRYGLVDGAVDPSLQGLLLAAAMLGDDPELQVFASRLARRAVREHFAKVDGPVRLMFASGLTLEADPRDLFAAELAAGWLTERIEFDALMALIEPGSTTVDVGANFGLYACHAALYAGPSGRVVAFEPHPAAAALLRRNVASNGVAAAVTIAGLAVAAAPGAATLHLSEDSSFSSLRQSDRSAPIGAHDVVVTTLDAHEAVAALPSIDFLKIDVEGHEAEVFAGAIDLLRRSPDVVILVEHNTKNLPAERRAAAVWQLQRLEAEGFLILRPDLINGERLVAAGALPETFHGNLFLCRKESRRFGPLGAAVDAAARRYAPLGEAVPMVRALVRSMMEAHRDDERLTIAERRVAEVEALLALRGEAIDRLSSACARLEAEKKDIEELARRSAAENDVLRSQKDELEALARRSEGELVALRPEKDAMEALLRRTTQELDALREEKDAMEVLLRRTTQELDALREEKDAMEALLRRTTQELDAFREEKDAMEALLRRTTQELDAFREEKDAIEALAREAAAKSRRQ